MGVCDIRGVRIGEGRPRTIVSLLSDELTGLLVEAHCATVLGADCLEWRVDHFSCAHASELVEIAQALAGELPSVPLILTMRSVAQGGRCGLPVDDMVGIMGDVIEAGAADVVDIEACWGEAHRRALIRKAHANGVRTIVSEHVFEGTPSTDWMVERLVDLARHDADMPKLAVMAHDHEDCLRLMEATARASDVLDKPLITMAMGIPGMLSRLAGECFGSAMTFCALEKGSAPGQVGLPMARRAIDALHDARGSVAPL